MVEYQGSCHCGETSFTFRKEPEWLTSCNCSICQKYATLWAYDAVGDITISGNTDSYIWGDKTAEFHFCRSCGCVSHWIPVDKEKTARMAVNFRLIDPAKRDGIRIRHFDGADTWEFLD